MVFILRDAARSAGPKLIPCIRGLAIAIARRVFSPDPREIALARRVVDAIPDGSGVMMLDGKMQDDASWKQSQVLLALATMLAEKDPDFRALIDAALTAKEMDS